jgi:sulfur relay (sulfurtransferase) complex TusBCD TusD component (DsrE family)
MNEAVGRKIGLVLGANPSSGGALMAVRLAESALANGCRVSIFLVDDGLYMALESSSNKSLLKRFQALSGRGAEITLCSVMLRGRGIEASSVGSGIELGSLLHFAELITTSDKVLFFFR